MPRGQTAVVRLPVGNPWHHSCLYHWLLLLLLINRSPPRLQAYPYMPRSRHDVRPISGSTLPPHPTGDRPAPAPIACLVYYVVRNLSSDKWRHRFRCALIDTGALPRSCGGLSVRRPHTIVSHAEAVARTWAAVVAAISRAAIGAGHTRCEVSSRSTSASSLINLGWQRGKRRHYALTLDRRHRSLLTVYNTTQHNAVHFGKGLDFHSRIVSRRRASGSQRDGTLHAVSPSSGDSSIKIVLVSELSNCFVNMPSVKWLGEVENTTLASRSPSQSLFVGHHIAFLPSRVVCLILSTFSYEK